MIVELYNGYPTKKAWDINSEEFIDDIKPYRKVIEAVSSLQVTYGMHVKIAMDSGELVELDIDGEGFIHCDGVLYGDVIAYVDPVV